MRHDVRQNIVRDLNRTGVAYMSHDRLGLEFNQRTADELIAKSPSAIVPRVFEGTDHLEQRLDPATCGDLARRLLLPVVHTLWQDDTPEWNIFGLNYFKDGQATERHSDLTEPDNITTVVLSVSGVRRFNVYDGSPAQTQRPGSIVVINGQFNPDHRAVCINGPSISLVADVQSQLQ